VCHKLSRAAAAATQSLELNFGFLTDERPQLHAAFLSWTSSHGSSLTRLVLRSACSHSGIRELACPHLLELNLTTCRVQLGASSEGLGLLHSCTALTQLVLMFPVLLDGVGDAPAAAAPAAVAKLPRLILILRSRNSIASEAVQALEARVVPHLTSLTHLRVKGFPSSRKTPSKQASFFTKHSSTMVNLRLLSLESAGEALACVSHLLPLTAVRAAASATEEGQKKSGAEEPGAASPHSPYNLVP
jgi:hypothetical protein